MITYVLRHGETDHSRLYLVNGDPKHPVDLNDDGVERCDAVRNTLSVRVSTWLSSAFPRARETASRLMRVPDAGLVVDPRLDELDYGDFEGGQFLEYAAWLERNGGLRRPPGARESQHEGIGRMFTGLQAALEHSGPRAVVCHGLLVSVLHWIRERPDGEPMPLFFPEAPYVQPVPFGDEELLSLVESVFADLAAERKRAGEPLVDAEKSHPETEVDVATFDRVNHPHAQRDLPDA